MTFRSIALLAAISLAACSGGASGGTAPVPAPPAPSPVPGSPGPTVALTLSFNVGPGHSSTGKAPAYVSPSSTQIKVLVNTVNGSAPPAWVPASTTTALTVGGNCTLSAGTQTCTVPVAAPPGTVNYTFTVGDGTNDLSTFTGDETIVSGVTNALNVTLQGIVKTVTATAATLAANAPPASNHEVVTVTAFDADANAIVPPGNYKSPITLTDNDPTGVTTLSLNGGSGASSVIVTSPADVVTLNYAGQAENGFTLSASGTGITGGGTIATTLNDVTFAGTTLDDAAHGGLSGDANWGQQTVFFAQASGTQVVTGAELGFTNAPYGKQFDVTLAGGCSGVATVSSGPALAFTITAAGVGVCSGRLTEHGAGYPITSHTANSSGNPTHDGTFWISVTTASIGVSNTKPH